LSHDPRPGFARFGELSDPLFFECDKSGQIVWMSQGVRSRLGPASTLVDAWACGRGFHILTSAATAADIDTIQICFTRLLEVRNRVLVGGYIQVGRQAGTMIEETDSLRRLHSRFLGHLSHLSEAQWKLAARVGRRRAGGHRLVRQMDLERQRLGRELHTGVGQALAAIRLQLEVIDSQMVSLPEPVRNALNHISILADQALQQVRGVAQRLHPPEWQRLTIGEALRQLWEITGVPERFDAALNLADLAGEPAHAVKVLLYRTAQEALSNLIRHSGASRVEMSLLPAADRLVLIVRDNGKGFDPERVLRGPATVSAGIGLRSIREQVEAMGGEFLIRSGANGTTLEVTLPKELPGEE
jgi:signal transduction histidine kinase